MRISPETWDRFNPRLTSAARRTWLARSKSRAASTRFNPRLTSAARRTEEIGRIAPEGDVSIRASLQQRGEPVLAAVANFLGRFQSAPHFSSEANVGLIEIEGRFGEGFNPRLTSAARRTLHWAMTKRFKFKFQSAPHFSSEANSAGILQTDVGTIVSIRASLQQRGEPICKYM